MTNNKQREIIKIALALTGFFFLFLLFLISPPLNFPTGKIITIEKGTGLKEVAQNLEKEGIIRSSFVFSILMKYSGNESNIKAGKYLFEKRFSVFGLMRKLIKGDYNTSLLRITIPEGSAIKDINRIFKERGFDDFEIKDRQLEGYLFPDTYFFPITATAEEAAKKMKENFDSKITPDLNEAIKKGNRKFEDILKMASLIEKEAAKAEDRKIISGILWKRLEAKIPLQVDATLFYVTGKNTFELTTDDLKINSPYNTYRYLGLPLTPICNPGLDAIKAAVFPEKSPYWYYLSDRAGNVYYSKTHDEHIQKKQKYL